MAGSGNRVVTFMGPMKMELQTFDYPKLVTPTGKKANHGAIFIGPMNVTTRLPLPAMIYLLVGCAKYCARQTRAIEAAATRRSRAAN